MKLRCSFFCLAASFCFISPAFADHPATNFGNNVGGPIWTTSPETLPAGNWAIGIQAQYQDFDSFTDTQLKNYANQTDGEIHSVDSVLAPSLGINYGVTNDFMLGLSLPYVVRSDIREGAPPHSPTGSAHVHGHGSSAGFGDANLSGQWKFFDNAQLGSKMALLLGTSLPVGETNVQDANGQTFEADHQPGTGAFNPFLGLAVEQVLTNSAAIYGNAIYTKTFQGTQDTRIGDIFNYNLAATYRLFGAQDEEHAHQHSATIDGVLEFNGIATQKVNINGETDPNTGSNVIFVSPGVRLSTEGGLSSSLSIGMPIYQRLNGIQARFGARILLGTSYNFS